MHKKKSLGQHFLHSAHYLSLIAETGEVGKESVVLEIGPGDGALTKELLGRGAHVVAVEKDSRLIPVLKKTFAEEITKGTFVLYEADALEFSIEDCKELKDKKFSVVANIPYYITGALLKKLFSQKHLPTSLTLLVQKEVAERIARSEKESILSLSVKLYGTPHYIKTVPAGAFSPPPAVDSAILHIEDVSQKNIPTPLFEEKFFELVKAGFSQKRKLLKKNIAPLLQDADEVLSRVGIGDTARAEDLTLRDWLTLTEQG